MIATALGLEVLASSAFAQGRQSTTQMTCSAAQAIVQSQGAAVLGTGGDTFDRFVRDPGLCQRGQTTRPGFAPTTNNSQCLVGWRCYDPALETR